MHMGVREGRAEDEEGHDVQHLWRGGGASRSAETAVDSVLCQARRWV